MDDDVLKVVVWASATRRLPARLNAAARMSRNETNMLACRSNRCGESRGEAQLPKLQLRGYVVNRGTKADQAPANRYYYFCRAQNFTWVEIKPIRKVSYIKVELFGRVQTLDEQGSGEVKALLGRREGMRCSKPFGGACRLRVGADLRGDSEAGRNIEMNSRSSVRLRRRVTFTSIGLASRANG